MKKLWSFVLFLAILAGLMLPCAAAGSAVYQQSTPLSDTTTLVNETWALTDGETTKPVQANYILNKKGTVVYPIVSYGKTLYGRSDMSVIASYLKDNGLSFVAGVNGSFFDMENGIPYGPVVTDGLLRSSGSGNAIGFFTDGSAAIGAPEVSVSLQLLAGSTTPLLYNKAVSRQNGLVLYSQDYDEKTKNAVPCYQVVLRPVDASAAVLKTEDKKDLEVTGMLENTKSCPIPDGCFVLAIAEESDYPSALEMLKSVQIGDRMQVTASISSPWRNAVSICGGGDLLVENGTAASEFTLDTANTRRARTAAGIQKDGTLLLYTADETSSSAGMTLPELAERMQALGCITAINLDGGGSTTLGAAYPGYSAPSTVNTPSDGSMRPAANFIFLVRPALEPMPASKLFLYPYGAYVLPGAKINLTLKAADSNYMPAEVPTAGACTAVGGKVDKGVLTVDADARSVTVTAVSGNAKGTATYQVLDSITGITLKKSSGSGSISKLHVGGGSVTDLNATASSFGRGIYSQDESFSWAVDPALGSISPDGKFKAADVTQSVSSTITVTYGSFTKTLPVTVSPADPFADVKGHWAEDYINELYFEGILAGSSSNGKLCYRPGASMTRQEFVVALMRYLGTNLSAYQAAELPFDDADSIADWAQDAVKAAYSLGYFSGSASGSKLLANPQSTISRQETMVILSRTLKLSAEQDRSVLASFSDSAKIADWAKDALAAMVSRKIIGGSNGRLNPTGNVTRAEVAKMLYVMANPE